MHTTKIMETKDFIFSINDKIGSINDIFEDFNKNDRIGLVVSKPGGVSGASALIMAAITAFYDFYRPNLGDNPGEVWIYPDYFIFHVSDFQMDGFFLDIWPPHKEVIVEDDPEQILEAINDRGITRLIVEDNSPTDSIFLKETLTSAKNRIKTTIVYSSTGRTSNANIEVTSCQKAEKMIIDSINVSKSLSNNQRQEIINQRKELYINDNIVESYRSINLDNALNMLTNHNKVGPTTKKYLDMIDT